MEELGIPSGSLLPNKTLCQMYSTGNLSENLTWEFQTSFCEFFNTTTSKPESSFQYLMSLPQQFSWIALYSVMLFTSITGNSIVAWIVLAHRRMRTVTNYFLVNLSIADLLMSIFNCMFNFIFMLNNNWPFGSVYCTINNFVANLTVAASVFTLVAISFDRYLAIVRPLRPRMSKCSARVVLCVVWLSSVAVAFPCLLYSGTISYRYPNGNLQTSCLMLWPDGLPNVSRHDYVYNIVLLSVTYLLPVTVMAACYSKMGIVLWGSQGIGELNYRQAETIRSKRKVVRMFIVIVSLFATCWLPYHVYFLCQYHKPEMISVKYVQHIYLSFYWLAMCNAMINPLVYYWMNSRFRQYFNYVICACCVKWYSPSQGANTQPVTGSVNGRSGVVTEGLHSFSSPHCRSLSVRVTRNNFHMRCRQELLPITPPQEVSNKVQQSSHGQRRNIVVSRGNTVELNAIRSANSAYEKRIFNGTMLSYV